MVWVLQGNVAKSLIGDDTVADDLDLWLMRDCLQIRVEDGSLSVERLAMSVGVCSGIEALCDVELSFWGHMRLILEDKNLMVE